MSYSSVHSSVCLKLLPNAHSVLFCSRQPRRVIVSERTHTECTYVCTSRVLLQDYM